MKVTQGIFSIILFLTTTLQGAQLELQEQAKTFTAKNGHIKKILYHYLPPAFLQKKTAQSHDLPYSYETLERAAHFLQFVKTLAPFTLSIYERHEKFKERLAKLIDDDAANFHELKEFLLALHFFEVELADIQLCAYTFDVLFNVRFLFAKKYFAKKYFESLPSQKKENSEATSSYVLFEAKTGAQRKVLRIHIPENNFYQSCLFKDTAADGVPILKFPNLETKILELLIKIMKWWSAVKYQENSKEEIKSSFTKKFSGQWQLTLKELQQLKEIVSCFYMPESARCGLIEALSSLVRGTFSETSVHKTIAQDAMQAFPQELENLDETVSMAEKFFSTLENPGSLDKMRLALRFLLIASKNNDRLVKLVLDRDSWRDLEVICGPKSNPTYHLSNRIVAATNLGQARVVQKLAMPEFHLPTLVCNQEIVKNFLEDGAFLKKAQEKLKQMGKDEPVVLGFWNEQDDIFKYIIDQDEAPFFIETVKNWFNEHDLFIDLKNPVQLVIRGVHHFGNEIVIKIPGLSEFLEKEGQQKILNYFRSAFDVTMTAVQSMPGQYVVDKVASVVPGVNYVSLFLSIIAPIVGDSDLKEMRRKLHKKLLSVAHYMQNVQSLADAVRKNNLRAIMFPHLAEFPLTGMEMLNVPAPKNPFEWIAQEFTDVFISWDNFWHPGTFENFLAKLNTKTFQGEPSATPFVGRLYSVHRLMYKHRNRLEGVMLEIGELDSQIAVANLYERFNKPESLIKMCFPVFVLDKTPFFDIKDFWNLSLLKEDKDPKTVVTNPPDHAVLRVGKDQPGTIIITGPNAGGKSTTLKAIILAILLAQSLGIAPAESLKCTPFSHMKAYLNITDDVSRDRSLFKAAVLRALDIIKGVEAVAPGECSLTIFDELFNGTEPVDAEAAATVLINRLCEKPQNLCLAATHSKQLTKLAQEKPAKCANYKVSVDLSSGKIMYPFKLEKGVSDQHIAFEILAEAGFDTEFIEEGKKVRKKILESMGQQS